MNFHRPDSAEPTMLAPSKSFVARAIPTPGGYIAQFSAPGLIPAYVGMDQDNPDVFDTPSEAENAARKAMMGVLNKPRQSQARGRNAKVEKLSGPAAAVLIAEANVSLTWIAYVAGTSVDRVQSWVDGLDFMPHPVRLLLEAMKAHPELMDLLERITDDASTERRPR